MNNGIFSYPGWIGVNEPLVKLYMLTKVLFGELSQSYCLDYSLAHGNNPLSK